MMQCQLCDMTKKVKSYLVLMISTLKNLPLATLSWDIDGRGNSISGLESHAAPHFEFHNQINTMVPLMIHQHCVMPTLMPAASHDQKFYVAPFILM